jgi:diguanylate cyclase (GGDEF)-like protein/PAS domain S-box-containing protein
MFGVRAWMERKRKNGASHLLATRGIAGFVVLACTVLVGLETSRVLERRANILADGRRDTANLAGSLIQHAELIFRSADAVLTGVAERLEHDKMDAPARDRMRSWLERQLGRSPQFTSFAVIDSEGFQFVNTVGKAGLPSVSDRDFFIYHRDHADDAIRIGSPIRGRFTGRWVIPVTRRFNKPDGSFGGLALVAVDPQYFQDTYDRLELGKNGNVLLVSLDRKLLVRRPYVEANVGRTMSKSQLFDLLREAPSGSADVVSSTDGILRLISYEQGKTYPIAISVAQDKAELLAPWKDAAMHRLLETAGIACFILLMGAFVWRATKDLARNSQELRKTNARFDAALANMSTGLSMFDADGRLLVWNERYIELYGMSHDVVRRGVDINDIIAHRKQLGGLQGDAKAYVDDFRRELAQDGQSSNTSRLKNGRIIEVTNTAISGGGWVAIHEDITERVGDEEALFNQAAELARTNLRFNTALSTMKQGLSVFDERKRLVVWNKRFAELYDVPEKFLKVGTAYEDIMADRFARGILKVDVAPEQVEAKIAEFASMARDAHRIDELADGRFVLLTRQPMPGGGWLSIMEDITERRRAEAEIVHLARHDALTGLPNRARFNEKLAEAGKRMKRGGTAVAVMMLDLDRFKTVNDTLGHPAGDALLIEVGRRLKATVRDTDLLARLGGDEFAIIQQDGDSPHEAAIALALRIISAISEPFDINGFEVNIGTSIGMAIAPEHGIEPEVLLKSADLALYAAKADGRNDYRIYHPSMLETATSQQSAESELRDAIAQAQFELHYQPVVDVETREVCGVEALVRWRHPVKGLVGPDQFIPVAESTGLIGPIGEWILQQACSDAAKWPSNINLAINISAVQFKKGNLLEVILCALVESGLEPQRLELEITETSLLENQEAHLATIRQLKNLGISLALDDFGTGYSSVTYLTNFPFDKIKIDRSFTAGVLERRDYAAVVSSVLALAQGLGKVTTVEGIETEQQFDYMRQAGVNLAQGYLFSRPVPASQLDFSARYARREHMVA